MAEMEDIFVRLNNIIQEQQQIIKSIADNLEQIKSIGGGGGSASIEDYESNKLYTRNILVVDTETETVYRVIDEYTSVTVEADKLAGHLKLVGYESQIVTFDGEPSQEQIDLLPENTLVAIYSSLDDPYTPVLDNNGNG